MSGHGIFRLAAETPDYAATDVSGGGAAKNGGRWNTIDTPMVYAATSLALACLETLVHLEGPDPLPWNRYVVRLDLPADAWKQRVVFDPTEHPAWDALPAGMTSMQWGTDWARGLSSLVAVVPSIVVPEEGCVLINPLHPDMAQVRVTVVRKWVYDRRL
jgi:RES domain-containing protein